MRHVYKICNFGINSTTHAIEPEVESKGSWNRSLSKNKMQHSLLSFVKYVVLDLLDEDLVQALL